MTEIRETIQKLLQANQELEQQSESGIPNQSQVRALHSVLSEMQNNMEELKQGVGKYQNSPIKVRK